MSGERLISITLDERSIKKRSAEVEHERNVAIADLLDENVFEPSCMKGAPYTLHLGVEEGRLALDIGASTGEKTKVAFPLQPLRGLIRDYFMICESYYEALKTASPSKIEAIDMARRGVHNEGGEELITLLKGRINIDFTTARRLFTLICVLHIK